MKISLAFLVFFLVHFGFSQELKYISDFSLEADRFIGTDNFENYYFIKNNILYKKTTQQTYTYSNTQLGEITSVDITNPLKILLFFRDFNTVLFLDNQLNKLSTSINFTTTFSKNIAFVNLSSNNNFWLYSFDDHILQIWNYQTQKKQFATQPLSYFNDKFTPIKQISTYKNCWLIGKNTILKFNEYGSFIKKYTVNNQTDIQLYKDGFISLRDSNIYYQDDLEIKKLHLNSEILTKKISIKGQHIYIFNGSKIFVYKILKI